jgi:hypothetical protein
MAKIYSKLHRFDDIALSLYETLEVLLLCIFKSFATCPSGLWKVPNHFGTLASPHSYEKKEIKSSALYLDPTVTGPCTQIQWLDSIPPLRTYASSQIGNNSSVQGLWSLNHSPMSLTTSVSSCTTPHDLSNLKQFHFLCSPCSFLSPQTFSTLV